MAAAESIRRRLATQTQRNMEESRKRMNFFVLNLFEMIIEGVANNMRNDFELDPNGELRLLVIPENPEEQFVMIPVGDGDDEDADQVLQLMNRDAEKSAEVHPEEKPIATHQEIEKSPPKYLKKRYFCPVEKCRKKFEKKTRWESHLRMHKARPFGCRYRGCEVHYKHRSSAIRHILVKHFKLPKTLREQRKRKIVDNRNPNHYVRIAFD